MAARNQQLPVNEQKQQTKNEGREQLESKGKPEILQSDMQFSIEQDSACVQQYFNTLFIL